MGPKEIKENANGHWPQQDRSEKRKTWEQQKSEKTDAFFGKSEPFRPRADKERAVDEEDHYKKDSPVGQNKEALQKTVDAHWAYVEQVILSGADKNRKFSFEEVMEMRRWDYTSAARHFYGHGFEDGEASGRQRERECDWAKEWFAKKAEPKPKSDGLDMGVKLY